MRTMFDMDSVRWMPKKEIAFVASHLVERYEDFTGTAVLPPVALEDIVERFLEITLEYADLKALLDVPDILGATWVNERKIIIDESLLDDDQHGRMFFTLAHEVGHWCIHRKGFFGPAAPRDSCPEIVCRESGARARGEWQADYFAASLLMPEMLVRTAFAKAFGFRPITIYNRRSIAPREHFMLDPAWEHVGAIAGMVIQRGHFNNVSKTAMRIRLEELGLLINHTFERLNMVSYISF